ncbi:hypothetical protein L208DRAFT_777351 [Tricholoma matsutake]|nr:hypothetical protein L208DRAFT_777351 [Tricholoma matsutake 945]
MFLRLCFCGKHRSVPAVTSGLKTAVCLSNSVWYLGLVSLFSAGAIVLVAVFLVVGSACKRVVWCSLCTMQTNLSISPHQLAAHALAIVIPKPTLWGWQRRSVIVTVETGSIVRVLLMIIVRRGMTRELDRSVGWI